MTNPDLAAWHAQPRTDLAECHSVDSGTSHARLIPANTSNLQQGPSSKPVVLPAVTLRPCDPDKAQTELKVCEL